MCEARAVRSSSRIVTIALAATLVAGAAHAQETAGLAHAQALFDEGRAALSAGDAAAACPKFAESHRLAPAVGTLLNLGVCYEKLGKLASAWGAYNEAAAMAVRTGQNDRAAFAKGKADGLTPKLPKLTIDVPEAARVAGLEVKRDGAPAGAAEWGSALPVDPGTHSIEASAPGKIAWSTTVEVSEEARSSTVTVPVLQDVPAAPPPAFPPGEQPEAPPENRSGARVTALVAGGLGLAAIGTGVFFGLRSQSKSDDVSDRASRGEPWTDETKSTYDEGKSAATIANVLFIGGGVALATAAVFGFIGWRSRSPAVRAGLTPRSATVEAEWRF